MGTGPIVIAAMVAERNAGLYVPNVETVRLVRDERGWLRLATQRESLVKALRSVAAIEGDQRQEFVK